MKSASSKKALQVEIAKLEKQLKEWSYHYYIKNQPLVSDAIYDYYYHQLQTLYQTDPSLIPVTSITNQVGFKPVSQAKLIAHPHRLLSLDNAFDYADLNRFQTRLIKTIGKAFTYHCELKIDGLPVNLTFKNHLFQRCATRGDGEYGEDVTANFLAIADFASRFKNKFPFKDFELRGEIYMPKLQFQALNKRLQQRIKRQFQTDQTTFQMFVQELQIAFPSLTLHPFPVKPLKLDNSWNHNPTYQFEIECQVATLAQTKQVSQMLTWIANHSARFYKKLAVNQTTKTRTLLTFKQISSNRFFLNPRNAASGSLRQLDRQITKTRNLAIAFFHFASFNALPSPGTQAESLKLIADQLHFPVVKPHQECKDLAAVWNWIQLIKKQRHQFPFEIDGIVIKVNEFKYYQQLGATAKFPRFALAYKFPDQIAESQLLKIETKVGRTGKIGFIAHLKPTFLLGSIIRRATLHNAAFIRKLDLRLNDTVLFKKAGGIIPKIIGIQTDARSHFQPWNPPTHCPYCHFQLVVYPDEVDQYCLNWQCPEIILRRLEHFVSRSAYNIKGLSIQTLKQFYDLNLIADGADLFHLLNQKARLEKLIATKQLLNFQELGLNNLFTALKMATKQPLSRLLIALGIRHLGSKAARLLAQHFQTLTALQAASSTEWYQLKGIGPKLYQSWKLFSSNPVNQAFLAKLVAFPVQTVEPIRKQLNHWLTGKTIVITGTFPVSRAELRHQLEALGVHISEQVSSQTDYLLCGAKPGSKRARAQQLKLKFLNWEEIKPLLKA